MKVSHLVLLFIVILSRSMSFGQLPATELMVPDTVRVAGTDGHTEIPKTKLTILLPPGYFFYKDSVRFQKNKDTYIEGLEMVWMNFIENKDMIKKELIKMDVEKTLYFEKDFSLNGYPAFIMATQKNGIHHLGVVFGNEYFAAFVSGNSPVTDLNARDEILSALLTTCRNQF